MDSTTYVTPQQPDLRLIYIPPFNSVCSDRSSSSHLCLKLAKYIKIITGYVINVWLTYGIFDVLLFMGDTKYGPGPWEPMHENYRILYFFYIHFFVRVNAHDINLNLKKINKKIHCSINWKNRQVELIDYSCNRTVVTIPIFNN